MADRLTFLDPGDGPGAAAPSDPAAAVEALRLRAADALERGLAFAEAHGDAASQCLAKVILRAAPPSQWEALERERQRADGAFAARPPTAFGLIGRALGPGCQSDPVLATGAALVWLADVRALRAKCIDAATRFLEGAQHADGSFGGGALPDDERLVATALIGGALGRTQQVRPACLVRTGDFLVARWNPDLVEGAGLGPLLAWSHFFTNVPHDAADEILQWCGRELEKGFRSGAREALATARVLTVCDVSALPGSAIAPADLLSVLLGEQASDGGFDALAPEGAAGRVVPTLEAMQALIGMCAGLDD